MVNFKLALKSGGIVKVGVKTKVLFESATDCSFEKLVDNSNKKTKQINNNQKTHKVLHFENPSYIIGRKSIVSKKEAEGPIGKYFDQVQEDAKYGQKNFELAEISFLQDSIMGAIRDAGLILSDIDMMMSGDLLNQLTTSNFVARNLGLPFLGLYSACSSMSQALLLGTVMIDGGHAGHIVCGVSSHFASAERQFRMPLEYGGQKPPYSQWTVTGAGSSVLSNRPKYDSTNVSKEYISNIKSSKNDNSNIKSSKADTSDIESSKAENKNIKITKGVIGTTIDMGTHDIANMGAAMAPAFLHSLVSFLKETETSASDYDLIVSGDLGKLGSDIARTVALEQGIKLGQNYIDCGAIMYNNFQNAYQGGSGCACSATAINSFVLPKIQDGTYKKVLYLATGALMSPQSTFQGESIPCISHGVLFEAE